MVNAITLSLLRDVAHTVLSSKPCTKWMVESTQVYPYRYNYLQFPCVYCFGVVKKIKLQGGKKSADEKILREVSALRLLTHRYIVRYYTTWTEIAAPPSRANSDSDSDNSDADTVDGTTSVPNSKPRSPRGWSNNSENLLSIDLNDFGSNPNSNRSFPNVHFGYADGTSAGGSSDDEEPPSEDESHLGIEPMKTPKALTVGNFAPQQNMLPGGSQVTLYIQMVSTVGVRRVLLLNPVTGICREADTQRAYRRKYQRGRSVATFPADFGGARPYL
jgi:hypothetical protein